MREKSPETRVHLDCHMPAIDDGVHVEGERDGTASTVPVAAGHSSVPADVEGDPSLDPAALDRLKEICDEPEFLLEVVEGFLNDAAEQLEKLRAAAASQDPKVLEGGAHSLKSSSASVGGLRMSFLCKTLEEAARSGNLVSARELVESLGAEFERLTTALEKVIGRVRAE